MAMGQSALYQQHRLVLSSCCWNSKICQRRRQPQAQKPLEIDTRRGLAEPLRQRRSNNVKRSVVFLGVCISAVNQFIYRLERFNFVRLCSNELISGNNHCLMEFHFHSLNIRCNDHSCTSLEKSLSHLIELSWLRVIQ